MLLILGQLISCYDVDKTKNTVFLKLRRRRNFIRTKRRGGGVEDIKAMTKVASTRKRTNKSSIVGGRYVVSFTSFYGYL